MNLIVISNPESTVAAIDLERWTESATAGRGRADLVVEPAELARMTSLLDHPDEKVVGATIWHSCHVSMRL